MTDYNNPKTIDCNTCTERTLCMFYKHGVRAMLQCSSYISEVDAEEMHSAMSNEMTAMFNQPEEGGAE